VVDDAKDRLNGVGRASETGRPCRRDDLPTPFVTAPSPLDCVGLYRPVLKCDFISLPESFSCSKLGSRALWYAKALTHQAMAF
jgi:hypothetical protein